MPDPYLGEIKLLPYSMTLHGWLPCEGQMMQIRNNQALFSLLGTQYGGDGKVTFGLPDLRGRVMVGSDTVLADQGEQGGSETVTLLVDDIPRHIHMVNAVAQTGTTANMSGALFAGAGTSAGVTTPPNLYGPLTAGSAALSPDSVQPAGNSLPHPNMQPYLGLCYMIATQGIYPSRAN